MFFKVKRMRLLKFAFSFAFSLFFINVNCQNRNSVWCFGDSSLIDFSDTSNPIVGISSVRSRGSCASISDSSGRLLFYSYTRATIAGRTGLVYDSTHQLMQNGNLITGQGWYNEMVIVPDPSNSNLYYLFSIGVNTSCPPGLYYSTIDMNLNGGLGAVVLKNIQLDNSLTVDGLSAVKHGNGRDWWIIARRMDTSFNGNKRYYKYLVDPSGVNFISSQAIGQLNQGDLGPIVFNSTGTQMAYVNTRGLIDVMNFNRCTANLSQIRSIEPETPGNVPFYVGVSFSPNGNFLYISKNGNTSYLFQYDLSLLDPAADRDTIWSFSNSPQSGGQLRLAPDGKIYYSNAYFNGVQYNYPYADSMFNYVNMNLGVINDPDQLGLSCNFQPFSLNLGGKRTYWGLPNNPDYELGPLVGSLCDTLVSIDLPYSELENLFVYYSPIFDEVILHADQIEGKYFHIKVYDMLGKEMFTDSGLLDSKTFTKTINCSHFSNGIYVISFFTDKGKGVFRFVK